MNPVPAKRPSPAHRSPELVNALGEIAAEDGLWVSVRGDCMVPVLHGGDRVRVQRRRWYLPGDLLAFRAWDGKLLVHRLLGYRLRRGRVELVTAADAADKNDVPVRGDAVIGRVIGSDPARSVPLVRLRDRGHALRRFLLLGFRRITQRAGS